MTPTLIRNGMILGLVWLGVVLWVVATWEDRMAALMIAGLGCWLLAYVYAQVTLPKGRD